MKLSTENYQYVNDKPVPPTFPVRREGVSVGRCKFCASDKERKWVGWFEFDDVCINDDCLTHYLKTHELSYVEQVIK